jgi:hypothetical protein
MRYLTLIVATAVLSFCCLADALPITVPKEVKTRDELIKTFGTSVGFGSVERAEFSRGGRQVFAVWYCPFSGRAACYLHAYYFDPAKAEWILFVDRLVEGAPDLSAEMPTQGQSLIFRDAAGKIVVTESVAKIPVEKRYDKK